MKKALKEIVCQSGIIAFFASVMFLSAPWFNPEFPELISLAITGAIGVGEKMAAFLTLFVPALVGSVGMVANVAREL